MDISLTMDAASLAKIQQLADWQPGSHFYDAMGDSLNLLEAYAVNFMFSNFINPGGTLEGNFVQTIMPGVNSIEGELANPTAWAWRQEEGFSGQTDSLGRYFPHTPEYHYMQNSLDSKTDDIIARFELAVQASLSDLAGV